MLSIFLFLILGDFFAFSAFYYTTNFLNLPENATISDWINSAEEFCQLDYKELEERYGNSSDWKYINDYCFNSAYYLNVLLAYGFPQNQSRITFASSLKNVELSWTLGAMIYEANLLPCKTYFPFFNYFLKRKKKKGVKTKNSISFWLLPSVVRWLLSLCWLWWYILPEKEEMIMLNFKFYFWKGIKMKRNKIAKGIDFQIKQKFFILIGKKTNRSNYKKPNHFYWFENERNCCFDGVKGKKHNLRDVFWFQWIS